MRVGAVADQKRWVRALLAVGIVPVGVFGSLSASSVVVLLDGAAARVRDKNILSIFTHVAKPLSARVFAVWQGLNGTASAVMRKYGVGGWLERDTRPEEHVLHNLRGLDDKLLRTLFYAAYTKFRAWEAVRGLGFKWLLYTRSDMRWLADFPPAYLWDDSDFVWVPDHADWGGLYDRVALIPHRYAETFLRGPLRALMASSSTFRSLLQGVETLSSEVVLARVLKAAGAKIGSFPLLGAIRCCEESIPECSWHSASEASCYRGYRNRHEYVDAAHMSYFARGGSWVRTVGFRSLIPPCFEDAHWASFCCESNSSICFHGSDFYTERRCCGDGPYLTVRNPWAGPCWSLSHPDDAPIPPVACLPP